MDHDRVQHLERLYRVSLEGARKRLGLSLREVRLLLDVCDPRYFLDGPPGRLRAEVRDAIRLQGLDRFWDIDGRSLIERLRDLPAPLTMAVELWGADWWALARQEDRAAHLALLVGEDPAGAPTAGEAGRAGRASGAPGASGTRKAE